MDILIRNMEIPKDEGLFLVICPNGTVEEQVGKVGEIPVYNIVKEAQAVAIPSHGRLVSAEDFIDSFEDIINECRRQLSEKGEDITVLNYFHDTIVELMGYMPTVLEANNGNSN